MSRPVVAVLAVSLLLPLGSSSARAFDFCELFPDSPQCTGENVPTLGGLRIDKTRLDFGEFPVGGSLSLTVRVTNMGEAPYGPVSFFGEQPTGAYSSSQGCQGETLQVGGSCHVRYAFEPTAPGSSIALARFTLSHTRTPDAGTSFAVVLAGVGSIGAPSGPCPAPTACLRERPLAAALAGSARLKGRGFRSTEDLALAVDFDDATFVAAGGGEIYFGRLAPLGLSGTRFRLFLDRDSRDVLTAAVVARAAVASGRAAQGVLGENAELVLKLKEDGTASLRVRSNVLVGGIGKVAYTANLTGDLVVP